MFQKLIGERGRVAPRVPAQTYSTGTPADARRRHRTHADAIGRTPTPSAGLTAVGRLAGESSLQEQLWLIVSLKMSSSGQGCRRVRLRGRDCTPTRQHVGREVKLHTRPHFPF